MPVLTNDEIAAVEDYVREHFDEVMEQDQRIRQQAAARKVSPEIAEAQRQERQQRLELARREIRRQRQEPNGDQAVG